MDELLADLKAGKFIVDYIRTFKIKLSDGNYCTMVVDAGIDLGKILCNSI